MVKVQNSSVSNSVLYFRIISLMDIHCGDIYIVVRLPPKKIADSFSVFNFQERCMKICVLLENKTAKHENKIKYYVSFCARILRYTRKIK